MSQELKYTTGLRGILRDCRWRVVILWFLYNCFVFYATRLINRNWHHYRMETALDRKIPFSAPWILVYVFVSYISWYVGFVLLAGESKRTVIRFFGAEIMAKTICFIFFLILPTTMTRPEVTGSGFFSWLTRLIYSADTPDNLFPSIHCLESWIIFRSASHVKRVGRWYPRVTFAAAILVFLSTLFVKQHVAVDVVGGVAAAEAGLLIMRFIRFRADK